MNAEVETAILRVPTEDDCGTRFAALKRTLPPQGRMKDFGNGVMLYANKLLAPAFFADAALPPALAERDLLILHGGATQPGPAHCVIAYPSVCRNLRTTSHTSIKTVSK